MKATTDTTKKAAIMEATSIFSSTEYKTAAKKGREKFYIKQLLCAREADKLCQCVCVCVCVCVTLFVYVTVCLCVHVQLCLFDECIRVRMCTCRCVHVLCTCICM